MGGGRVGPALGRVTEQARKQADWRRFLQDRLPAEAFAHVSGVVERDDTLVVFTESAAWSARVRYAVAEIDIPLNVVVRVLPRS